MASKATVFLARALSKIRETDKVPPASSRSLLWRLSGSAHCFLSVATGTLGDAPGLGEDYRQSKASKGRRDPRIMQRMLLARACGENACGLEDVQRQKWSYLGPEIARDQTVGFADSLTFIDISTPDGALLLCGGAGIDSQSGQTGACVGIYQLAGPGERAKEDPVVFLVGENVCRSALTCGKWMPDDAGLFVIGGTGTEFSVWDTTCFTVAQRTTLGSPEGSISALDMSAVPGAHTGLVAVSRTDSFDVSLVDLATGASTHRLQGHSGPVRDVVWSPTNPHFLASTGLDGVRLFDVRRAGTVACLVEFNEYRKLPDEDWDFQDFGSKQVRRPPSKRGRMTTAGSRNQTFIHMRTSPLLGLGCAWESASASQQRRRKRRSAVNGKTHFRRGHSYSAWRVRFSPDGTTIISGGMDGSYRVWDVHTGRLIANHRDPAGTGVGQVVFELARDDYHLLTDNRGDLCAIGIDDGTVTWRRSGHAQKMSGMTIHPLNEELYTASGSLVRCWSSQVSNR